MAQQSRANSRPGGGPGAGGFGSRPKLKTPPGKLIKMIFSVVLKGYTPHIIIVVVTMLITSVVTMQGNLFIQELIDDYITPLIGVENADFMPLAAALFSLGLIFLVGVIATFVQTRIMIYVSQGSLKKLREDTFNHMQSLPVKYFDSNSHGDIMSVYTNDIDTLRQLIGQALPQLFNSGLTLIVSIVSMLMLNVPLTLVMFVMIIVMMFASKTLISRSGSFFKEQQQALGDVNGYIEEMMHGQKVVKVFNYEERSLDNFNKLNDKLQSASENANKFANIVMPVNGQLGNLSYVLVAIIGATFAINGIAGVTVGSLVAFLSLSKSITMPLSQLSMQANFVVMGLAGAERIFELQNREPEIDNGTVSLVNARQDAGGNITECSDVTGIWAWKLKDQGGNCKYVKQNGHITLSDVTFGYVPEKTVLSEVDLEANPGDKIAFVGSTGAGKTTITNLINRFYDIDKGQILYDGININTIKKSDLRRSLGMVLQDTHLFTGTVLDNIRYGRLDATDEECISAAKLANADKFVKRLPNGYETVLSADGGSLSGGQRQLLAIARAAVANPPALILDEATSSIDTMTEKLVQEGMDSLMKGRTTFVIAHRLSTVKNSDCIMVLENGKIIERGSHDKLLEMHGKYHHLYTGLV